jgi:hypothetical protein
MPAPAPPAIRPLPSHRPDLLIFEITGTVGKSDIKGMAKQVDDAFGIFDRIDLLLLMPAFAGLTPGAIADPSALAVSVRSLRHVRKYAVVGAPGWARMMIEIFAWLTPVEERTFSADEAEEARAWVHA